MAEPRVAAAPVRDCGEPLVDLRSGPEALLVDGRRGDPDGAFAHLRQRVRDRLLGAQRHLPEGQRVLVVEGYRPPCPAAGVLRAVRTEPSCTASGPDAAGGADRGQPLCVSPGDRPAQCRRRR